MLPGVATTDRPTWQAILPKWRGLTREEVLAAVLLECALTVLNAVMFMRQLKIRELLLYLLADFALGLIACLTLLLGIVAADAIANATARRVALVLAVVISGLVTSMLYGTQTLLDDFGLIGIYVLLLGFVVARAVNVRGARWTVVAFAIAIAGFAFGLAWRELLDDPEHVKAFEDAFGFARWVFYQWLLLAGAATFAYLDWRRTRAARARTHAAQVDRARSARRALESRLQAMQARVEPQFLFNTLSQVRELYRRESAQGERMLEELIAFLRAAMPKMRDTSSTVGQEIELVRAYLAIVAVRFGGRLTYEIEPADAFVAEARMPPMMLLPLVDHAIANGFAGPRVNGLLQVRAALASGCIRLQIGASETAFLAGNEGAAITGIRERLAALYGDAATLALHERIDRTTEAVLEIPFETERPVVAAPVDERVETEPLS